MYAMPLPRRSALLTLGLAVSALVGTVLSSCGADRGAADRVLVFAASDLQPVLPEIVRLYAQGGGGSVRLVFGSSGSLATQIENGAPASLYLAANEEFVDRLIRGGHVDSGSRAVYARGRLALVSAGGLPGAGSVRELSGPEYGVIAIANPEHAPYGRAAREALEGSGVWAEVSPRLVLADNVVQAFQLVASGSADAGLVAYSLVLARGGPDGVLIPEELHAPLRQTGGVLSGAPGAAEAAAFLHFLATDSAARSTMARYGFEIPGER
jgi:molybdate transport system substrate-binding protein